MVGITGDPRILILDGLTPFGIECRVSARSGELRSAQLGSSERCTLLWIVPYFVPDRLMAAPCMIHHSS